MIVATLFVPTTIHGWAVVGWMVGSALVAMVAIVLILDENLPPL